MERKRKLKNSGETLIETLGTILIISIVSVLFFSAAVTSQKINEKATSLDKKFQTEIETAEKGEGTREGSVNITTDNGSFNYDVYYSGENGAPISYRLKENNGG